MSSAVRSKLLVSYIVLLEGVPIGVVDTNGYDQPTAEAIAQTMASKRWRFSRAQLTVKPWDDCTRLEQQQAAGAEAEHWAHRHAQLASLTGR